MLSTEVFFKGQYHLAIQSIGFGMPAERSVALCQYEQRNEQPLVARSVGFRFLAPRLKARSRGLLVATPHRGRPAVHVRFPLHLARKGSEWKTQRADQSETERDCEYSHTPPPNSTGALLSGVRASFAAG